MLKNTLIFSVIVGLTSTAVPVSAVPDFGSATLSTPGTTRTLMLPENADNSPVISLGTSVDPGTGEEVEGYAIVHYKNSNSHKEGHNSGGALSPSSCYRFLARGAKWKTVEPWVMNTTNSEGLTSDYLLSNMAVDISKWEDATDGILANAVYGNILGDGSLTTTTLVADTSSPDNVNEVYFADVTSSGAIAVTIVWGVFSGPTFNRKLVEWDMIFDDVDFNWSSTGESGKMDFENIATHELGHSIGLGDLYDSVCSEQTMYGFAANGETKKQTLESGDINGTNALY